MNHQPICARFATPKWPTWVWLTLVFSTFEAFQRDLSTRRADPPKTPSTTPRDPLPEAQARYPRHDPDVNGTVWDNIYILYIYILSLPIRVIKQLWIPGTLIQLKPSFSTTKDHRQGYGAASRGGSQTRVHSLCLAEDALKREWNLV
jgi:hypothetical protein